MMFVLVVVAIIIMFYIYQRSLSNGKKQDNPAEWVDMSECRGYVGIIGAIMTLVGICLPFASYWFVTVSFMEYLIDQHTVVAVIVIITLVIEVLLYTTSHHGTACAIAVILAVLFFSDLGSDGMSLNDILDMVESGFWVMSDGVVLMCVSPFMKKLNLTIRDILTT